MKAIILVGIVFTLHFHTTLASPIIPNVVSDLIKSAKHTCKTHKTFEDSCHFYENCGELGCIKTWWATLILVVIASLIAGAILFAFEKLFGLLKGLCKKKCQFNRIHFIHLNSHKTDITDDFVKSSKLETDAVVVK